jgi:serine/threonine protein kinase
MSSAEQPDKAMDSQAKTKHDSSPLTMAFTPADYTANASGATTDFVVGSERVAKQAGPTKRQGESLGNYEILSELGRGGMGVVYKAIDRRLGRPVALKVILSGGHAGDIERQRFQLEVEAAARLQHPNIVQVYEVGQENDQPFMAMEFCAGGTLEDRIRDQPQPPREAAQILLTLADALQHAHEAGIVHRDIKPANVLLSADGSPKIVDFGLAKRLDGDDGFTQTGAIMGSFGYMAPEQASGRTRDATASTDVYSLGALLYKLLAGRPPFQGTNDLETINSIVARDPVSIRSLQPRVPMDLVTICHKSLEKNPARRYASAAAMADDLRRFLFDLPIVARPLGPVERSWRWARRHPGMSMVLVSVVTMLLLVAGCLAWSSYRSYRLIAEVNEVQKPLQELSGRIRYLDEVLTSAALLSAATGDSSWEQRYRLHEPQLIDALQEAVRLAPEASQSLTGVEEANTELEKKEKEAFTLVRNGRSKEAYQLLTGIDYLNSKKRYSDAIVSFTADLDQRQATLLSQARTETKVFIIMASATSFIVLLLFSTGGWVVLRSLRRT